MAKKVLNENVHQIHNHNWLSLMICHHQQHTAYWVQLLIFEDWNSEVLMEHVLHFVIFIVCSIKNMYPSVFITMIFFNIIQHNTVIE